MFLIDFYSKSYYLRLSNVSNHAKIEDLLNSFLIPVRVVSAEQYLYNVNTICVLKKML